MTAFAKHRIALLFAFAAAVLLALAASALPAYADESLSTQADEGVAVYRLYNDVTSEHLFTTSRVEAVTLANNYSEWNWLYEGVSWVAPSSGTPVHRLYNPYLGHHLYTSGPGEIADLCASWDWQDEGVAYYSGGAVNIYRLYNPVLRGLHLITTSTDEYNALPAYEWRQEGNVFSAVSPGTSAAGRAGELKWVEETAVQWVPDVVTVVDTPAWDEQVFVKDIPMKAHFDGTCNCGQCGLYCDSFDSWIAHQDATGHIGCHQNVVYDGHYETVHHDAVTHTEDHGSYQQVVVASYWN